MLSLLNHWNPWNDWNLWNGCSIYLTLRIFLT